MVMVMVMMMTVVMMMLLRMLLLLRFESRDGSNEVDQIPNLIGCRHAQAVDA